MMEQLTRVTRRRIQDEDKRSRLSLDSKMAFAEGKLPRISGGDQGAVGR